MRIGIFGARGDSRGLSIQTTELARHLNPTKIFGVDMRELSPYPNDWSDFDQDILTIEAHDGITDHAVVNWLKDLDVVIGAETFYYRPFTEFARRAGVKTVLVVNYEFTSHVFAEDWAPVPDVVAVPTTWHIEDIPNAVHLPHGIDRERLPFRQRIEAKSFLHIIGHSAAYDRQGTKLVLGALRYVESDIRIIIRAQHGTTVPQVRNSNIDIEVHTGSIPNYWELYDEGDVLLHPRKYGGQSLVMNEALSCGMPVLMPNAPPQNSVLPVEMLLPSSSHKRFRTLVGDLPLHIVDPQTLARRIDELANDPEQVTKLSKRADEIAETQSWPKVLPRYHELFESLCR